MTPVSCAPSVGGHTFLLRAVAAYGLRGSMLDLPQEPLADDEFESLLATARASRLTGHLWQAVLDGAIGVTAEQVDRIEQIHMEALTGVLVLERLLIDTVTSLNEAGVPVRVLKGPAVARLDFAEPEQRTFGDIDLLIPGEHFDDAARLLQDLGHQRSFPEPRPGFDRKFSKGSCFRTVDGLEIDLHRTFSMGPFGMRLDLATVWASETPIDLAGHSFKALGGEERFLHACFHATLGDRRPKLAPLRDVAQIALRRDLDLDKFHRLVRASRAEAVIARAVRAAWSELHLADVVAISAWAHSHRDAARGQSDLAAYGEGSTYTTKSVAAVRAVPGWRDRSSYLFALLLPQSSYVERDASRLARFRRAVHEAGSKGRRR